MRACRDARLPGEGILPVFERLQLGVDALETRDGLARHQVDDVVTRTAALEHGSRPVLAPVGDEALKEVESNALFRIGDERYDTRRRALVLPPPLVEVLELGRIPGDDEPALCRLHARQGASDARLLVEDFPTRVGFRMRAFAFALHVQHERGVEHLQHHQQREYRDDAPGDRTSFHGDPSISRT